MISRLLRQSPGLRSPIRICLSDPKKKGPQIFHSKTGLAISTPWGSYPDAGKHMTTPLLDLVGENGAFFVLCHFQGHNKWVPHTYCYYIVDGFSPFEKYSSSPNTSRGENKKHFESYHPAYQLAFGLAWWVVIIIFTRPSPAHCWSWKQVRCQGKEHHWTPTASCIFDVRYLNMEARYQIPSKTCKSCNPT